MKLLPCGDAALLVELADLDEVLGLHAALVDEPLPGVLDVVPAARTVLVRIDPGLTSVTATARAVRHVRPRATAPHDATTVDVPVTYDGADLADVAQLTGLGEVGVIEAHTAQLWRVAFAGFAPGFAYLVGKDPRLHVPRLETPRTRVPAGSVGLAGEFSGIYPRESPGGWRLIGRTELDVWDLARDPPALLLPGATVRFGATS